VNPPNDERIFDYLILGADKARWQIDKDPNDVIPKYIKAIVGHTGSKFAQVGSGFGNRTSYSLFVSHDEVS